jgi:ankyrin repeat protein
MNAEEVKRFLATSDLKAPDQFGYTALHIAAAVGEAHVAQVLLSARASTEARDHQGQTPLMRAAARGNLAVAQILVDSRADLSAEDNAGLTSLAIATFSRQWRIQELLLVNGASPSGLDTAKDLGRFLQDELDNDRCGLQYEENMEKIRNLYEATDYDMASDPGKAAPSVSNNSV